MHKSTLETEVYLEGAAIMRFITYIFLSGHYFKANTDVHIPAFSFALIPRAPGHIYGLLLKTS